MKSKKLATKQMMKKEVVVTTKEKKNEYIEKKIKILKTQTQKEETSTRRITKTENIKRRRH